LRIVVDRVHPIATASKYTTRNAAENGRRLARLRLCEWRGEMMKRYYFEVLRDGAGIITSHSIALPNVAAAWARIANLARTIEGAGHKIQVKDERGGIVILVGIITARRYADAFAA
jgi:hypothetical protein